MSLGLVDFGYTFLNEMSFGKILKADCLSGTLSLPPPPPTQIKIKQTPMYNKFPNLDFLISGKLVWFNRTTCHITTIT